MTNDTGLPWIPKKGAIKLVCLSNEFFYLFFSTLCDPYLNIFRGIIPPLGGTLDLSPILAFLALNAITSAAAALPAELPPASVSPEGSLPPQELPGLSDLTSSQKKWQRRLQSKRSSISDGPN